MLESPPTIHRVPEYFACYHDPTKMRLQNIFIGECEMGRRGEVLSIACLDKKRAPAVFPVGQNFQWGNLIGRKNLVDYLMTPTTVIATLLGRGNIHLSWIICFRKIFGVLSEQIFRLTPLSKYRSIKRQQWCMSLTASTKSV